MFAYSCTPAHFSALRWPKHKSELLPHVSFLRSSPSGLRYYIKLLVVMVTSLLELKILISDFLYLTYYVVSISQLDPDCYGLFDVVGYTKLHF